MEPDYKEMWNELKDAITKSGICGIDRRLQITLHDLDALEEKHTPWEPKKGDWVWGKHYKKPVYVKKLAESPWFYDENDNARHFESMEPLESHLPILEYKGFKVGERVRCGHDVAVIDRFIFEDGKFAKVWLKTGDIIIDGKAYVDDIEHLPPPEPDEYVTNCRAGRSVKVQKGKGTNVITIEYVDGDEICIVLYPEEVDQVIEYLLKLKKKLEE